MDTLWSPWRSEYIGSHSGSEHRQQCFLCACAESDPSPDNLVLCRTEHVVVVMNRFPYNAGHVLVAPRLHTGELGTLDAGIACELMHMMQLWVRLTDDVLKPHGHNLGANLGSAAGAGVPDHLHLHIVPRWAGDTNFMPVVGDVKVASQAILDIWHRYRTAFAAAMPEAT
jgi:ATP adenylyltransferase